jgi:hypothetical protein
VGDGVVVENTETMIQTQIHTDARNGAGTRGWGDLNAVIRKAFFDIAIT